MDSVKQSCVGGLMVQHFTRPHVNMVVPALYRAPEVQRTRVWGGACRKQTLNKLPLAAAVIVSFFSSRS